MVKRKIDLTGLSDVEIYKLVLSGQLKQFPQNFWMEGGTPIFHPEIVRYLINEICGWVEREEIARKMSQRPFIKNKLNGMLLTLYKGSPTYPIIEAFPEFEYKLWEFNKAPMRIWQGEEGEKNGLLATKWLFEEKLKWSIDEIRENASTKIFKEHNLGGMLAVIYDDSIWKCVNTAYPGVFKPWEIGYHMDKDCWNPETAVTAIKWLFEEKLQWTKDDMRKRVTAETFRENGLGGLLRTWYGNSPFKAVNVVYPGEFSEAEMSTRSKGYWEEGDNLTNAIRKLILEKLKWDREKVVSDFKGSILSENGFSSLVAKMHPYEMISSAFPEWDIKPWELKRSTRFNYWNDDNRKQAIKWMIEEKMGLSKEDAMRVVKREHFREYGIAGALKKHKGSIKILIESAFEK